MKSKDMQVGSTYMVNASYGRDMSTYYDETQLRERYSWTLLEFRSNYKGAKFAKMRNTFNDSVKEISLSKVIGKFEEELLRYLENREIIKAQDAKWAVQRVENQKFYDTVTKPKLFKLKSLLVQSGVWISDYKSGELTIHYNRESLDKLMKILDLEGDDK